MKSILLNLLFFIFSLCINYYIEPMRYIQNEGNLLPLIITDCIIQIVIGVGYFLLNMFCLKKLKHKAFLLLLTFVAIEEIIISILLTRGMGFDQISQFLTLLYIIVYWLLTSIGFGISVIIFKLVHKVEV